MVLAEERKERIRRINETYQDFKKWRTESLCTVARRVNKANSRTQSKLDIFLIKNLSREEGEQDNMSVYDQESQTGCTTQRDQ